MKITFDMDHVFSPFSDSLEDAEALRALLDCLTRIDYYYLKHHPTKPLYELHRQGVIKYGRTKEWQPIPALIRQGYGDCKSLATWRRAELMTRENVLPDMQFRWMKRPDGAKDFHILLRLPNGKYEDPSRLTGMGKDERGFGRLFA